MLEKRYVLEKGCVRKEGRLKKVVSENRGLFEKRCVRKEVRVREEVCQKRGAS